jgi:hypothetical protein
LLFAFVVVAMLSLSRAVPVPSQTSRPAALNDASEIEKHLASELDSVLSRKANDEGRARSIDPLPATDIFADDGAPDFDWIGMGDPADLEHDRSDPNRPQQWLQKARCERRSNSARQGVAWLLTLSIGGAIVAGASYVLLGVVPGFEQLVALGQRSFQ